jgi:DNA polymerase III sliding clamp (beta) subunit (PCNA family)
MSTINLSLSQLRAALLIAAKQDVRYYLNGVYVECDSIRTRVVATNGHMMYVEDYHARRAQHLARHNDRAARRS